MMAELTNLVELPTADAHRSKRGLRVANPEAAALKELSILVNEARDLWERLHCVTRPRMLRVTAMYKGDVLVFDARRIGRFCAAGKYTSFCVDGEEYLANESLRSLEARLRSASFMRVHRSELVNLEMVVRLKRGADGGIVVLEDGQEAVVSRTLLQMVRERLTASGNP